MKLINKTTLAIASFIISFSLYLLTLAPGVQFTDSGELAGVCVTLGIAHPTGYPLFAILGHIWSLIPFPFSKIYSLNLFAAFLTTMSSMVFFVNSYLVIKFHQGKKTAKQQGKSSKPTRQATAMTEGLILIVSFISALAYAASMTIWEQGTSIEVYSLQLLLINLVLFTSFSYFLNEKRDVKFLLLSSFLLGLGFANHMTTILLLPALLYFLFRHPGEGFDFSAGRWKLMLLLMIPLLLGVSFYLYLPFRSSVQPEFNWGYVSRSFDKFLYHIQGKQYQVWMFTGAAAWKENAAKFFSSFPLQFGWIGLIPMLFGIYESFRKSRELFYFLVILALSCIFYTFNYSIHDIETYFVSAFIAFLLFASAGIAAFTTKFPRSAPLFFLVPLFSMVLNYSENDKSKDYLVEEYTRNLVNNLKPNAIVISAQWDYWCSAFWYKQRVEGWRKDVALVEKELLRRTWFPYQLKRWYPEMMNKSATELDAFMEQLELFESGKLYDQDVIQQRYINFINSIIEKNYGKRPIYLTMDVMQTESEVAKSYQKIPEGFAFRLEKDQKPYPVGIGNLSLTKFIASGEGKTGHLEIGIKDVASINVANIGRYAQVNGDMQTARKAFDLALRINPANQFALQCVRQMEEGR